MTREEAIKFWKFRYENSKDFSDPHWEAQERREHREYVEALRMAIEALSKPIVDITQRDLCADISCTDCPFMQETCKLMDYVAYAEAAQGWIPCSERLPDERQDVYVTVLWDDYGDYITAYGMRTRFGWHLHSNAEGELIKGYTVIAWMPLPKPYKGGDSE